MKPLLFLASAFINTFGITRPSPENERRVAYFLGVVLLLVLLGLILVGWVLHSLLPHAS